MFQIFQENIQKDLEDEMKRKLDLIKKQVLEKVEGLNKELKLIKEG